MTRRSGKKTIPIYLIVGNKNDNQVGQVVLCSSKNLTDWKFETILASNENGDIGTMWECPDFFALKDKHVLICSPQDMKARKYEFHNGHNSVYFWETTMQTDADSAKNSRIHLIMVWFLCSTDNRTSGWQTDHDRMDEIMGCLCDTEFAGLAGNDDISERIGDKRKPYLAESGE